MSFFTAALIMTGGSLLSGYLGSRSANKRAEKQQEAQQLAAQQQRYIDGSVPGMPAPSVIEEAAQMIAGSEVGQGLQGMEYEDPEGRGMKELIQDPAVQEQLFEQYGPSPELEALLQSGSGLMGDGASSGVMAAARGGAVGRPKDVYYFSVPNIQKMMGDGDPGIQNVGQQMMGQIQANPEQGMVQASAVTDDGARWNGTSSPVRGRGSGISGGPGGRRQRSSVVGFDTGRGCD